MHWTPENEQIAKNIAIESQVLYMAHNDSYRKYKKMSLWFVIPTILLSSITGGLSFNESFNSNDINKLVLASMSILIAFINSLFKILNIDDQQVNNYYLSKMWYILFEKIRIELLKNPNDRLQCDIFINEIVEAKQSLLEKNIVLDKDVIAKYKNKYNKKIELPLSLKHLSPIIIYNECNQTPLTPSINSMITEYTV